MAHGCKVRRRTCSGRNARLRPMARRLLVFHDVRCLPERCPRRRADGTMDRVVPIARSQPAAPEVMGRALRHALGFGDAPGNPPPAAGRPPHLFSSRLLDPVLESQLRKVRLRCRFDSDVHAVQLGAAAQYQHFETYNRTAAGHVSLTSFRLTRASRRRRGRARRCGPSRVLAAAVVPSCPWSLDVWDVDTESDADYLKHLYVPGPPQGRRTRDCRDAPLPHVELIHNAGARFTLDGAKVRHERLTPDEIVAAIRATRQPNRVQHASTHYPIAHP